MFQQGHLGLFVGQAGHDYCRLSLRSPRKRNIFSTTNDEGCKWVDAESSSISKNMQPVGEVRHRPFSFLNISRCLSIDLVKVRTLQSKQGCIYDIAYPVMTNTLMVLRATITTNAETSAFTKTF